MLMRITKTMVLASIPDGGIGSSIPPNGRIMEGYAPYSPAPKFFLKWENLGSDFVTCGDGLGLKILSPKT